MDFKLTRGLGPWSVTPPLIRWVPLKELELMTVTVGCAVFQVIDTVLEEIVDSDVLA